MTKKEKILKISVEEFSKYGFDAVSMNDLVKKLDINKATIYYHFKDKRSLYNEVIKCKMEILNKNIQDVFSNQDGNQNLIKKYVDAYIKTIKDDPSIIPLALREIANYGANIDDNLVPYIKKDIKYLKIAINKLDLDDKYKDMDIYAFYAFINGTIKTFYAIQMSSLKLGEDEELKQNSEKTLDYISEFISNIILDAIKKK